MFGFIIALSRHLLRHFWTYIQASNGDRELSDDSENSDTDDKFQITISCSSTAANQSKLVITPQAPKEEMDISFTEEDQPAPQLHITNADQSKTDSSTKKDKKKRKKKNFAKTNHKKPISTQEKGKSLERTNKQSDIHGEDEANYIVTGFQLSPISMAVRDILIYDIPAKWSNFDILQHLSS
ncbi:hypothetical protein RclHR1_34210001 [Rhizophagus clarus]|uniref:Uncharacterized protein n=1 Tax=Rhizophagus clarus TaxID=94130 RepID=A0A2Z6RAI9_9GLOM|nr:hypothetical protein RclHR1_34210001 [Rhizophagus clarus]